MRHRWPWSLIALLVVLVNGVAIVHFGVGVAARIAFAGASNVAIDGLFEGVRQHELEVIDVRTDPEQLAALQGELPFGGRWIPATVLEADVAHAARFRYRGAVITSHYLGQKRSFRLVLGKRGPFSGIRRVDLLNPKTPDLLANWTSAAIAREVGVRAPFDELVLGRVNGEGPWLMEAIEQVDGRFERSHGRAGHQVAALKGDYPAPTASGIPAGAPLWSSAAAWELESRKDSAVARTQLARLVRWVHAGSTTPAAMDSVDRLIDRHAFARSLALLKLLDTYHVDDRHNQRIVRDERSGLFVPVLWDAAPLLDKAGRPFYPVTDALSRCLLQDPAFRLERDRELVRMWRRMHEQGRFRRLFDAECRRILPAVWMDREKDAYVAAAPEHVYRTSGVHWLREAGRFQRQLTAYWDTLGRAFDIHELHAQRTDSTWQLRYEGAAALEVEWEGTVRCMAANGTGVVDLEEGTHVLVQPAVRPSPRSLKDPFVPMDALSIQAVDVVLRFDGQAPATLRPRNALTGAAVPMH